MDCCYESGFWSDLPLPPWEWQAWQNLSLTTFRSRRQPAKPKPAKNKAKRCTIDLQEHETNSTPLTARRTQSTARHQTLRGDKAKPSNFTKEDNAKYTPWIITGQSQQHIDDIQRTKPPTHRWHSGRQSQQCIDQMQKDKAKNTSITVSYTHLRAHET